MTLGMMRPPISMINRTACDADTGSIASAETVQCFQVEYGVACEEQADNTENLEVAGNLAFDDLANNDKPKRRETGDQSW